MDGNLYSNLLQKDADVEATIAWLGCSSLTPHPPPPFRDVYPHNTRENFCVHLLQFVREQARLILAAAAEQQQQQQQQQQQLQQSATILPSSSSQHRHNTQTQTHQQQPSAAAAPSRHTTPKRSSKDPQQTKRASDRQQQKVAKLHNRMAPGTLSLDEANFPTLGSTQPSPTHHSKPSNIDSINKNNQQQQLPAQRRMRPQKIAFQDIIVDSTSRLPAINTTNNISRNCMTSSTALPLPSSSSQQQQKAISPASSMRKKIIPTKMQSITVDHAFTDQPMTPNSQVAKEVLLEQQSNFNDDVKLGNAIPQTAPLPCIYKTSAGGVSSNPQLNRVVAVNDGNMREVSSPNQQAALTRKLSNLVLPATSASCLLLNDDDNNNGGGGDTSGSGVKPGISASRLAVSSLSSSTMVMNSVPPPAAAAAATVTTDKDDIDTMVLNIMSAKASPLKPVGHGNENCNVGGGVASRGVPPLPLPTMEEGGFVITTANTTGTRTIKERPDHAQLSRLGLNLARLHAAVLRTPPLSLHRTDTNNIKNNAKHLFIDLGAEIKLLLNLLAAPTDLQLQLHIKEQQQTPLSFPSTSETTTTTKNNKSQGILFWCGDVATEYAGQVFISTGRGFIKALGPRLLKELSSTRGNAIATANTTTEMGRKDIGAMNISTIAAELLGEMERDTLRTEKLYDNMWLLSGAGGSSSGGGGGANGLGTQINDGKRSRTQDEQRRITNRENCRDEWIGMMKRADAARQSFGNSTTSGTVTKSIYTHQQHRNQQHPHNNNQKQKMGVDAVVLKRLQAESRLLLDKLRPDNLLDFCELFCTAIVQAAATGEAVLDAELTAMAKKDVNRFQSLAQRFTENGGSKGGRNNQGGGGGGGGKDVVSEKQQHQQQQNNNNNNNLIVGGGQQQNHYHRQQYVHHNNNNSSKGGGGGGGRKVVSALFHEDKTTAPQHSGSHNNSAAMYNDESLTASLAVISEFPPHQRVYVMFLEAADSHKFNTALTHFLSEKLKELNAAVMRQFPATTTAGTAALNGQIVTMSTLASFLSYLAFYPQEITIAASSSAVGNSMNTKGDGEKNGMMMQVIRVDLMAVLGESLDKGAIHCTLPWVVKYLWLLPPSVVTTNSCGVVDKVLGMLTTLRSSAALSPGNRHFGPTALCIRSLLDAFMERLVLSPTGTTTANSNNSRNSGSALSPRQLKQPPHSLASSVYPGMTHASDIERIAKSLALADGLVDARYLLLCAPYLEQARQLFKTTTGKSSNSSRKNVEEVSKHTDIATANTMNSEGAAATVDECGNSDDVSHHHHQQQQQQLKKEGGGGGGGDVDVVKKRAAVRKITPISLEVGTTAATGIEETTKSTCTILSANVSAPSSTEKTPRDAGTSTLDTDKGTAAVVTTPSTTGSLKTTLNLSATVDKHINRNTTTYNNNNNKNNNNNDADVLLIKPRLQRAFLDQYSSSDLPVKLRDVVDYAVDVVSSNMSIDMSNELLVPAIEELRVGMLQSAETAAVSIVKQAMNEPGFIIGSSYGNGKKEVSSPSGQKDGDGEDALELERQKQHQEQLLHMHIILRDVLLSISEQKIAATVRYINKEAKKRSGERLPKAAIKIIVALTPSTGFPTEVVETAAAIVAEGAHLGCMQRLLSTFPSAVRKAATQHFESARNVGQKRIKSELALLLVV